ncbi:hypothetical protein CTEN210_05692 [Chaetoceros tenuissimus]|uniref:Cation/H+ exchanger domain-containing protein n=1 Tax=Chaetoceros tenuissimus TaxID=426638 RepID=A0AAD3H3R1_9STRA|nr:hypothetical protein CTEN210_05692 [Chaetoceros tenuissimus]
MQLSTTHDFLSSISVALSDPAPVDAVLHALSSALDITSDAASSSNSHLHALDALPAEAMPTEQVINSIEADTLASLGRDILTFLFVTVLVIPLSNSLGMNPTLLFLLIGCILGPYNLQMFSNNEADLELGDFGILFLLFNEGLDYEQYGIIFLWYFDWWTIYFAST